MKFIIDNALSPVVSKYLKDAGFDSVHVRDYKMQSAPDEEIFDVALKEERIIVSADTDFSYILSTKNYLKPSLILFRKGIDRNPVVQAKLLIANLNDEVTKSLDAGCVVIFEPDRIRIRFLPLIK